MPNGSVADHFERRSGGYGSLPSWVHDEASLAAAVDAVAASYKVPPSRVLDLGAGTGALGFALVSGLRPPPWLVSLDVSAGMLARVAAEAPVVADAHNLPFVDSAFDLVVARQAVHYFDRPADVFAEVRRALTDGGCLLVSQIVPFEDGDDARYWTHAMALRQPLRRHAWTAPDLRHAMSAAGFETKVEATTVTRGSLNSWLNRYDVEDDIAVRLREHFETWMHADAGVRAFERVADDTTYSLRWVTLVARSTKP